VTPSRASTKLGNYQKELPFTYKNNGTIFEGVMDVVFKEEDRLVEVMSLLKKVGFVAGRQRGSHVFLRHNDGRATVVPIHSGETIGPGLLYLSLPTRFYVSAQ
jgi:predicted RNA binding protein YcfA (HicA-like mRNA interferase family)